MTPCPKCHGDGEVIESRACRNGSRRQRRRCRSCGHRWTQHQGAPPTRQAGQRFTLEEIERILSAVDELTIELNCSRAGVVSVLRRAAREPRPSCLQCQHWDARCTMGFPDPEQEGPGAAQWCSTYQQA